MAANTHSCNDDFSEYVFNFTKDTYLYHSMVCKGFTRRQRPLEGAQLSIKLPVLIFYATFFFL